MEENRKVIIVSGVTLMFLMGCSTLAAIALNPWSKLRSFGVGALLGLGMAIIFSVYMLRIWDPVTLQRKGSQVDSSHENTGCWLPVITVGGVITGRLLASYLASDFLDLFFGCVLSALTLTLFFFALLAWWHRPKNQLE